MIQNLLYVNSNRIFHLIIFGDTTYVNSFRIRTLFSSKYFKYHKKYISKKTDISHILNENLKHDLFFYLIDTCPFLILTEKTAVLNHFIENFCKTKYICEGAINNIIYRQLGITRMIVNAIKYRRDDIIEILLSKSTDIIFQTLEVVLQIIRVENINILILLLEKKLITTSTIGLSLLENAPYNSVSRALIKFVPWDDIICVNGSILTERFNNCNHKIFAKIVPLLKHQITIANLMFMHDIKKMKILHKKKLLPLDFEPFYDQRILSKFWMYLFENILSIEMLKKYYNKRSMLANFLTSNGKIIIPILKRLNNADDFIFFIKQYYDIEILYNSRNLDLLKYLIKKDIDLENIVIFVEMLRYPKILKMFIKYKIFDKIYLSKDQRLELFRMICTENMVDALKWYFEKYEITVDDKLLYYINDSYIHIEIKKIVYFKFFEQTKQNK